MSDQSSYTSMQSEMSSIDDCSTISSDVLMVKKDTQTGKPPLHNIGVQITPPSKHSIEIQTDKTEITRSSYTQHSYHDYLSSKQVKSEHVYQSLLAKLNENDCLKKLSNLLDQHDQTEKFVKLIQALGLSKYKLSNMSWKAALDMGYLSMCTSTTNMVYDKEWLEFCQVLYHMFRGGVMNTLRGRAHFSHVTSEKCVTRIFKPYEG